MIKEYYEKLHGVAECHHLSNDLFWHFNVMRWTKGSKGIESFHAEWTGYNDANWWNNVAPKVKPMKCVGDKGTEVYLLIDFNSGRVEEVEGGAE